MASGTAKSNTKTFYSRVIQAKVLSSVLVPQTCWANIAMLAHRQDQFFFDRPFALIDGHPRAKRKKKRAG
jgi:hypothetical protein